MSSSKRKRICSVYLSGNDGQTIGFSVYSYEELKELTTFYERWSLDSEVIWERKKTSDALIGEK